MPIAHRGLHAPQAGIIENTRAAFEAAASAGYAIELDVRASADGNIFVFHDARLERLTQAQGPFSGLASASLDSLIVQGSGETIPRLAEVLRLVRGRVPLFIEVKAEQRCDPRVLAGLHRLLRAYRGRAAVLSFSPAIVSWFARHARGLPRGLNVGDPRGLLTATRLATHFIGYDVRALSLPGAAEARRLGLPILAWTVKDAKTESIARAHADNIIFEGIRPRLRG